MGVIAGCEAGINDDGKTITDSTLLPTATTTSASSSSSSSQDSTPAAFTQNWELTSSENYILSSSSAFSFSSGIASLTEIDQTDDDNSATNGFAAGTHSSTQWDDANNWLEQDGTENTAVLSSDWTPEWNSLVGYWKMDSDLTDSSSNSNTGSFGGNATYTTTKKIGTHAVAFDGDGDYVNFGTSPLFTASATTLSVAAWVYVDPTNVDAVAATIIDTCSGNPATNDGLNFYLDDRGTYAIEGFVMSVATTTNDCKRFIHTTD